MSRSIRARARTAALILVAAGVAAIAAPFAASSPASAGSLGGLTFDPADGTDVEVPKVITSAGCPAATDGYNAFLGGPVFEKPYLIAFTQDVNFSTTGPFPVQLSESFRDAATERGVVLVAGDYPVTVQCVDMFTQEVDGTFTGIARFTSPTDWVGAALPSTSATPSASTSVSPSSGVSPSVSASPSASVTPSGSASPSAGASPSATATDPTGDPTTDPTTDPPSSPSPTPAGSSLPLTGPPALPIALAGAVLLIAGIVLFCSVDPVHS